MPTTASAPQRNHVISICKAIGIILMVVGHAEAPELLTNVIYTFHMPLFFITAGYFFSRRHADDPWRFCAARFKGLYKPFVVWSLVFLALHNVWHWLGVLNCQYGNWTGGVTHPYGAGEFCERLVMIFYSMSGYDEFMAGAFWFFRGLLVASILYLALHRLIDGRWAKGQMWRVAAVIAACALAFMAFHIVAGFKMKFYPNGFWRETWGLFFFAMGVVYRAAEPRLSLRWPVAALTLAAVIAAGWFHCAGMNNHCRLIDLATLPLSAAAGFLLVKYVAEAIDRRHGLARDLLVHIGDNTLYIFVFHILAFKAVSLLKIWYYGLDFAQIGCHMVIHYRNHDDLFWLAYSVAGVALPLLAVALIRRARAHRADLSR
jgi:fucose 4-O-acetylase-like acetyltransferase